MRPPLVSVFLLALLPFAAVLAQQNEGKVDEAAIRRELDEAISRFQEEVSKAKAQFSAVIEKLMVEAAGKGDLERAQKYRDAQARLDNDATVPDLAGLKTPSRNYAAAVSRATAKCEDRFDQAIKTLTKGLHLDLATAVKREKIAVLKSVGHRPTDSAGRDLPEPVSRALGRYRENVSLLFTFERDDLGTVANSGGMAISGTARECKTQDEARRGRVLSLGGASYVEVGSSPALSPRTWTIAAWIKPSVQKGYVIGKDDWDRSAPKGYVLRILENGNVDLTVGGTEWQSCTSTAQVPLNVWTHVAGVCDGQALRLYINGVPAAVQPLKTPIPASGFPMYVGWCAFDRVPHRKFEGLMDDVLMVDAPLPPDTVAKLYMLSK